MSHKYADIIIDISHEAIDRTFQYKIPETLAAEIGIGTKVSIPFGRGNHLRTGYVISFSDKPKFHEEKLKDIDSICENGVAIEGELIELAAYMKEQYGSTMINALKTVMPIKEKVLYCLTGRYVRNDVRSIKRRMRRRNSGCCRN